MEVVQRFRVSVVMIALGITAVLFFIALFFDASLAKGVALGGVAGSVIFWISARFSEGATSGNGVLKYAIVTIPLIRITVYALVLWKGYTYDPVHWFGFFGVVAGVTVVQMTVVVLGYSGWDLRQSQK